KELDESVVDSKPTGFNNTIRWQIGHVLVTTEAFLFGYPKQSENLPKAYDELFKGGSTPDQWSDKGPSLQELIRHLEKQYNRIGELSNEFLAQKIPFTLPFGNFRTYQDLYFLSLHHEAMHLGQCQAMKRMIETE